MVNTVHRLLQLMKKGTKLKKKIIIFSLIEKVGGIIKNLKLPTRPKKQ